MIPAGHRIHEVQVFSISPLYTSVVKIQDSFTTLLQTENKALILDDIQEFLTGRIMGIDLLGNL